ncbi:hypothetical protein B0H21DRAFT_97726 [Amylocystis lapponica]|nr:hypothetical protein B0H21DRAFT_97726 [Amylocystis lapponica]
MNISDDCCTMVLSKFCVPHDVCAALLPDTTRGRPRCVRSPGTLCPARREVEPALRRPCTCARRGARACMRLRRDVLVGTRARRLRLMHRTCWDERCARLLRGWHDSLWRLRRACLWLFLRQPLRRGLLRRWRRLFLSFLSNRPRTVSTRFCPCVAATFRTDVYPTCPLVEVDWPAEAFIALAEIYSRQERVIVRVEGVKFVFFHRSLLCSNLRGGGGGAETGAAAKATLRSCGSGFFCTGGGGFCSGSGGFRAGCMWDGPARAGACGPTGVRIGVWSPVDLMGSFPFASAWTRR